MRWPGCSVKRSSNALTGAKASSAWPERLTGQSPAYKVRFEQSIGDN
jgi:hypothetical protein